MLSTAHGFSPAEVRKIPNQCSQDSDATPTKPTAAILIIYQQ